MKRSLLTLLGSFLIIGSVSAQVPNSSFENWISVVTYLNPDNWATMNNKTAGSGIFTATKGTPGNPGNSFLKLTSKAVAGVVVNGMAVSGKIDSMAVQPLCGYASATRFSSLNGKWQYMGYGSTEGYIQVLLSKWNTTTNTRDTIAYAFRPLAGMVMSWANFSIPMVYKDSLQYPDSCMIVLSASGAVVTANDYLWVDNLSTSGTVPVSPPVDYVGLSKASAETLKFYLAPNPAKGKVTLVYEMLYKENFTVDIFDATGKLVKSTVPASQPLWENSMSIDTEGFARGIYTVVLKTNNTSTSRKLVIE